jgi:hypothetical protein
MATRNGRTAEAVRAEIAEERERLADAVDDLRAGIGAAADIGGRLSAKLPLVAMGALGAGFFLAGGVGATMRLIFRRGREGREAARVKRFSIVDRG